MKQFLVGLVLSMVGVFGQTPSIPFSTPPPPFASIVGMSYSNYTNPGAGNTYHYWLATNYTGGSVFDPSPFRIDNVNGSDPSVGHSITISFNAIQGAIGYSVLRTVTNVSPTFPCTCLVGTVVGGTYVIDSGVALGVFTPTFIKPATGDLRLDTSSYSSPSFAQTINGVTTQLGSGGSGTFTALTGDATSTATGGATTVKGINSTLLSGLATGILKNTTGTGVPSTAVYGDIFSLFTGCSGTMYPGFDGACHTASGSMTYPSGTGIPQVTSGTSWGTTLSTTGAGSYIPTVSNTSTFSTTASVVYTFPGATGTLPAIGSIQTWTALQTFSSGELAVTSGASDAFRVIAGAAYGGSNDGAFNRTTVPAHGFGTSGTPAIEEVYDTSGGTGTGGKLGVLPEYFSTGGSLANTAVSSFNLAAAPGSTIGQMWEVSGTVVFTGTITCTAGTFAATVTWTDGRGANSYSPVSVAYGSLVSTAASGTSLGGQYNFSFQLIQRSSTAPTFSTTLPTCTTLPYDWFVSARRIG